MLSRLHFVLALSLVACATEPDLDLPSDTVDSKSDQATDGTSGVGLPGGRASFVASIMGAAYNAAWLRIGLWSFADDGAVSETYWMWNQLEAPTPPSTSARRALTGYTTAGCPKVCSVWTTKGFEPHVAPLHRTGSWSYDSTGQVRIQWPANRSETYRVIEHETYVELSLVTHDYPNVSTVYASVFGSNASLEQGATIDQIRAAGSLAFTSREQNWDVVTKTHTGTIAFAQYHRCSASPALQGINPAVYHTYFAGDPARDGRKTFWYHQLEVVAQQSTCANIERGGHTYQLLQVLDDTGQFVGWVGGEASLLAKRNGGSIITHTQMIRP